MNLILFFIFSIVLSKIFIKLAFKLELVDKPNQRKIHLENTPMIGGVVIFILLSVFFIINFTNNIDEYLKLIYFSSILIFLIGFLDDIFSISAYIKLLVQFLATCILVLFDFKILYFFNNENIDGILVNFSIVITFISIIGLTNAFNFIDGIDGLCLTFFSTSLISIFILLCISAEKIFYVEILFFFFTIVIAFLLVNLNIFKLGKSFLGDSGSLLLGFYISCFLIYYSNYSSIKIAPLMVFWCVSIIVFDFLTVSINRIFQKKNPFNPDNSHIHHLLLKIGFSQKITLLILFLTSSLLNLFGILIFYFYGVGYAIQLFFLLFFLYYYINSKLLKSN